MNLENAIEFMLYTNFGIDFNDGKTDIILNVAIDKAYNDATMQGAYNALKKNNDVNLTQITDKLKEEIKDLLTKESKNYLQWHSRICLYLTTAYENVTLENNDPAFTYGNAQKWVNMTMKYLYILSAIFHAYKFGCDFDKYYNRIRNLYKDLQVPVDSYILEAVWSKDKQVNGIPYNIEKLTKKKDNDERNIPGSYSSEKVNSWSKWNDTEYKEFQKVPVFENEEKPLDWEHRQWIRIAKKRKNKEKQKNNK